MCNRVNRAYPGSYRRPRRGREGRTGRGSGSTRIPRSGTSSLGPVAASIHVATSRDRSLDARARRGTRGARHISRYVSARGRHGLRALPGGGSRGAGASLVGVTPRYSAWKRGMPPPTAGKIRKGRAGVPRILSGSAWVRCNAALQPRREARGVVADPSTPRCNAALHPGKMPGGAVPGLGNAAVVTPRYAPGRLPRSRSRLAAGSGCNAALQPRGQLLRSRRGVVSGQGGSLALVAWTVVARQGLQDGEVHDPDIRQGR